MREPQRFPLGTRVANPVEGRTGTIEAFDTNTELYTLVYNDDHRDVLTANQTEAFVIRTVCVPEPVKESVTLESDPNQMLGITVTRTSTSYEGKRFTSSGQVTQYFPDMKRFRVLFADGLYADLTRDEVKQYAEVESDSDLSRLPAGESDMTSVESKTSHERQDQEELYDDQGMERPLNAQKFESRKVAYAVCREVVRIILSQKKMGKFCSDKQKVVVNNKDLQSKRALEAFVEADGLSALEKMLGVWIRVEKTQSAALLILKVLAMLPGVKEEHLRKTNIARTLRGIEKLSQTSYIDMMFGDLAHWIIQKWSRTAMNRSFTRSARDLLLEQQAQIRRAGTDGKVHLTAHSAVKLTPRQKETARLEALRTGADKSAESEQDPSEEVVVYLPQFNSLGSVDMRRPVRQTQVLESLAAKLNRDYEDSVRKHQDDDTEGDDDGVVMGRVTFGKPRLMHFSQHTPVVDLFCTARSKMLGKDARKSDGAGKTTSCDTFTSRSLPKPNKTQAPKKTILKVRDDVIIPASQIIW
uniref:TFIIS N-terminal domain-containing protein n=1 Tax=Hyaloperonospora arabidopsidis (strain Emoy2) TaxID=559515 RepID=M4BWY7_HYAAE